MDNFPLATVFAIAALGFFVLKSRYQSQRIALLASYLGKYQIEMLMEQITQGYLRALGEQDPERRAQVWNLLDSAETSLCSQFNTFAAGFSTLDASLTRVSTWPLAIPYADHLFPGASFDMRRALMIHAQGISQTARNVSNLSSRDKAFMLTAELFLMQHTCHWFCKSKTVASARMLARHQTPYAQLLASVSPETRGAYLALTGGRE